LIAQKWDNALISPPLTARIMAMIFHGRGLRGGRQGIWGFEDLRIGRFVDF
jgi:hypothetical protein